MFGCRSEAISTKWFHSLCTDNKIISCYIKERSSFPNTEISSWRKRNQCMKCIWTDWIHEMLVFLYANIEIPLCLHVLIIEQNTSSGNTDPTISVVAININLHFQINVTSPMGPFPLMHCSFWSFKKDRVIIISILYSYTFFLSRFNYSAPKERKDDMKPTTSRIAFILPSCEFS